MKLKSVDGKLPLDYTTAGLKTKKNSVKKFDHTYYTVIYVHFLGFN